MNSNANMRSIARRRQRLSIEYELFTRARLDAHSGQRRGTRRIPSQCLEQLRRQFLPHYIWSPPRWRIWMRRLSKDRALPDFCIIGPAKSGSSDLAVTIMSHPNVLCPLVKEFSDTDPLAWKLFYPTLRTVKRRARQLGVVSCACVAPYLHHLDVPVLLSALRPDAKIVIMLRNPVDLMFSLWKWTRLHRERNVVDRVPFLSTFPAYIDQAMEQFHEAPGPLAVALHLGIYATSVAHWLKAFGEPNIRVYDVADYFKDRNGSFQRLEQFLGLPHVRLPPRLSVVNRNPLDGLAPDADTSARLKEFFDPYNRRLWGVIGTTFPW